MFRRVTVREWERGVLFRNGRLVRVLDPGRHTVWTCFGGSLKRVSLRCFVKLVDSGAFRTRDMVPVGVFAVATCRITDVVAATVREDHESRLWYDLHTAVGRAVSRIDCLEFVRSRRDVESWALDHASMDATAYGVRVEDISVAELRIPRRLRRVLKKRLDALSQDWARMV